MDPLGFGLERFDALGRVQSTDNGEPVDGSGALDNKPFVGARELSRLLRDDPNSARCLMSHVVMHVLGRSLDARDDGAIDRLAKQMQDTNEQLVPLLAYLVSDDSFRHRGPERPTNDWQ